MKTIADERPCPLDPTRGDPVPFARSGRAGWRLGSQPTRLDVTFYGDVYQERDPATGEVVAIGRIEIPDRVAA